MVKYVRANHDNLAKIQDGFITYTGFDPSDNDKILVKTKESAQAGVSVTYVEYQSDEFAQRIFGYVYPLSYYSRNDYYKYGYPDQLHNMALRGDSGYVASFSLGENPNPPACCNKYQYFISGRALYTIYVVVNSIQAGVNVCIEASRYNNKEVVYI